MENNYLVILCAHIDSEIKRDTIIDTLIHLKKENVDVCLSLHTTDYLDEISKYCKFVIYDNNNEFLLFQDYINNAHHIDEPHKYGYPNGNSRHDFFSTQISMPGSPHSKSALSLLRNGTIISESNGYKWTIYLEYDISIPKLGFKSFIETHIKDMETSNKKCFYYNNIFDEFNFLWGGFFIFNTSKVFQYDKFIKNKWYKNKDNWITEWYLGFFESIVEYIFKHVFSGDETIIKVIQDDAQNFWNVNKVSEISKFRYEETFYKNDIYLRKVLQIHLYPEFKNNNTYLHLYCYNRGDETVIFEKILIYGNNHLYHNETDKKILPYHWFVLPLNYEKTLEEDTIVLEWSAKINNEQYSNIERLNTKNLIDVHNNILQIKFD